MTCEEYQKTFKEVNPFLTTRGVRAAMRKHAFECETCARLTLSAGPTHPIADSAAKIIGADDMADPEFRDVVKGTTHQSLEEHMEEKDAAG
jgi:hypothetical protein